MRVAVIGATGNVGSRLVSALAEDPDVGSVVAVARRRPTNLAPGVAWRSADLAAPLPPDLLDGADAVVHLAWLFQPSHAPTTTWSANVVGTARLLRAVVEAGATTFVHASSVGAYSPRTGPTPVDETWPTHGVATSTYSVEKAYVERLLDRFELERPEVRVVRLRPGFIFRRESSVAQRRLFLGPLAPTRMVTRFGVPFVPDPGGLVFQTVHTDDVVEAYRRAVTGDVAGPFNVAADPPITMDDIATELGARVVRVPVRVTRMALGAAWGLHLVPAAPGMFDLIRQIPLLDTRRARSELGWTPRYSARDALAALVDGLRATAGGRTPPLDPETSGPLRVHEFRTGLGNRP